MPDSATPSKDDLANLSTEDEINPYQPSVHAVSSHGPVAGEKPRAVGLFLVLGSGAFMVGCQCLYAGLILLNQKWKFVPVDSYITDINVNGADVSEGTAMTNLLGLSIGCFLATWFLINRAQRNWRHNRSVGSNYSQS